MESFLPGPLCDRSHQEVLVILEAPGGDKGDYQIWLRLRLTL